MAEHTAWARETAADLLAPRERRWAHTLGVVEYARLLARRLTDAELDVLLAAAYLHDIGNAAASRTLASTPLDGARFLRGVGRERLACLVAHHSGARVEAEERRLLDQLDRILGGAVARRRRTYVL